MSLHVGDALTVLRTLPSASVQTCVTSPPYWGLRDYGVNGQLGLESTPAGYVDALVGVFQEVRRVLREDGTLWLNLGDTYCNSDKWGGGGANTGKHTREPDGTPASWKAVRRRWAEVPGIKPKDLIGIPWRVAFALQADGWWLRAEIIWNKKNCMPESVRDRPTRSHEHIFLMSQAESYYYDADAISEPIAEVTANDRVDTGRFRVDRGFPGPASAGGGRLGSSSRRNKRSVWDLPTQPYPEAHFATFPPDLIKPCILAGSRPGDTVLDPFAGAGTTLYVAKELNREGIGIELNPAYVALAERRTRQEVLALAGPIHAPASAERRAEPHPE